MSQLHTFAMKVAGNDVIEADILKRMAPQVHEFIAKCDDIPDDELPAGRPDDVEPEDWHGAAKLQVNAQKATRAHVRHMANQIQRDSEDRIKQRDAMAQAHEAIDTAATDDLAKIARALAETREQV